MNADLFGPGNFLQPALLSFWMTSQVAGPALTPPTPDSDLEADLEVDQLDSDSEINEDVPTVKEATLNDDAVTTHPSRTKPGERLPGHSLLSISRVENMIQADGTLK
jgi:hypothetical protein